jgi:hypothetical protein
MATENKNTPANVEAAVAQAIGKVMGRKFGVAVVGMWMLSTVVTVLAAVSDPTVRGAVLTVAWMIFGIAGITITAQLILDGIERFWLKKDLPDGNGNGNDDTAKIAVAKTP